MIKTSGGDLDLSAFRGLSGEPLREAVRMLRLGLESCDQLAPRAILTTGDPTLVPELRDVLEPANLTSSWSRGAAASAFRAAAVIALNRLEPSVDRSGQLAPLIAAPFEDVRITAAMAARDFHKEGVKAALLGAVKRDRSVLVRYHAAESLLALWDVHPRGIADHRDVFLALRKADAGSPEAAELLERLMNERATAGACSAPMRPDNVHVRCERVSERRAALVLDASEGSCEEEPAALVFVESSDGCQGLPTSIISKRETVRLTLPPAYEKEGLSLEYTRTPRAIRAGRVELAEGANVLVLARPGNSGAVKWRATLNLRGRKENLVRTLIAGSPELRAALEP